LPSVQVARVAFPLRQPQAVPATVGLVYSPARDPWATAVLAHGAGSGPDSDVLAEVGRALAGAGVAVLSFAFAYRAAGRRAPDPSGRLLSAWRDALAFAEQVGPVPLVTGGRSLGGRTASLLAAEGAAGDALVLLAYPLTGRSGEPRTAHWPSVRIPALFVSGDRDPLCDLDLLGRERPALGAPSELVVISGADHAFNVRARDRRGRAGVLDELATAVAGWTVRVASAVRSTGGQA
jgi:predicted alpha/beta-hydrolase family hydrolase